MFQTSRGNASKKLINESLERGEATPHEGSVQNQSDPEREGSTVGILPGIVPVERYNHAGFKVTPG